METLAGAIFEKAYTLLAGPHMCGDVFPKVVIYCTIRRQVNFTRNLVRSHAEPRKRLCLSPRRVRPAADTRSRSLGAREGKDGIESRGAPGRQVTSN